MILTGSTCEPSWLLAIKSWCFGVYFYLNALSPALLAHVITLRHWPGKSNQGDPIMIVSTEVLKLYLADTMCGNVSSWGYFYTLVQLLRGMVDGVLSYKHQLLVLTGAKDPLSNGGKALSKWLHQRKAQSLPVKHVVIPGSHHKVEDDVEEQLVLTEIERF